jgi:hypothetical protein
MQVAARPYVMAGAALAATSLVAVTPMAQKAIHLPTLSIETRLVDESILNIPMNLLTDFANIPYNEVQALNSMAGSNFLGGNWWVPSSTNLWGIDTGDPTKVAMLTNLFAPFPDFNQGMGGLQYQLAGFLAAQLPVDGSCDAETCYPMTPPDVITGSTQWDRLIGYINALTAQGNGENFNLFQNWFQVPLQNLINGYTFDDAYNPSGPATNDPAFGFGDGTNPFLGGTIGGDDAMPWNGHTFYLNLFQPFQNYWEHLLEDPATDGDLPGTAVNVPTLGEFGQSMQSIAASLIVAFNPYTPGSPACPGVCDVPDGWSTRELVDMLDPDDSNPMIQAWLAGFAEDALYPNNNATQEQINYAVALLQTGMYNLTPEQLANYNEALGSINEGLPALFTNAGIVTDPEYLQFLLPDNGGLDPSVPLEGMYGGYNPALIWNDLLTLGENETNWEQLLNIDTLETLFFPLSSTAAEPGAAAAADLAGGLDPAEWATDLTDAFGFDPTSFDVSALFGEFDPGSLDLGALFGAFDPAAMSAEFANLLEDLTAAWVPDLAASALTAF